MLKSLQQTTLSKIKTIDSESGLMDSVIESISTDQRNSFGHTIFENVQCFPLQTLLMSINQTHVDLVSLDIEGNSRTFTAISPLPVHQHNIINNQH